MHETHPLFPSNGNQQYRGNGIVRYCPICACHRATGNGTVQRVLGLRQWVCQRHPKAVQQ